MFDREKLQSEDCLPHEAGWLPCIFAPQTPLEMVNLGQKNMELGCLLCTATSSAIHLAMRTRPMPPSAWQTFQEFPRIQGEISIHISVHDQILVGKVGT